VTEYLAGWEPLDAYIQQTGPLSPDDALDIAWPVARALQALHNRGVLHRCLRPAAVLVLKGEKRPPVKLLRAGLPIKRAMIHAAATIPDALIMSSLGRTVRRLTGYLPPELVGRPKGHVWVGPHSDLYAFGRLCALVLTGKNDPDTADRLLLPDAWQ